MSFETAIPFEDQEELTEPEKFYMRGLVEQGFEVRYDEERIYNTDVVTVSVARITLQKLAESLL